MLRTIKTAALLGLSIVAASSDSHAQQSGKPPRIGVIVSLTSPSMVRTIPTFQALFAALRDLGYEEGRDVVFRSAEGHMERLPGIVAELIALKVDVLVAPVCGAPLDAARQATNTIPIVVASCNDDMVETGIVASLAHPGGNVTGFSKMTPELTAKRLDLLKEMVPSASHVAVLWDPGYSTYVADWQGLRATARAEGVVLHPVEARRPDDLDEAFALMVRERADAVITFSDVMTFNFPGRVAELAAKSGLPLIAPFREMTTAGGLMSYGPNIPDMNRRAAGYVDKILKGANPSDLPVEQPTKFELLINLKTAKALRIEVPATLLARADEVIE